MAAFIRFLRCEKGATAIEYGLIATLIAIFLIIALTVVGTGINSAFQYVSDNIGFGE